MWGNFDFIKLLGGLGMFLFGMFLMEDAIKKLSSGSLRKVIRRYTSGTFKSIATGAVATTLLQSSSALSLIVLAFVGAEVISLQSAVGLILGANIGSTTTGWIVALLGFKFNIENFALPLIAIGGVFFVLLSGKKKYESIFQIVLGIGLLFLGLSFMKTSVEGLANSIDIASIPNYGLWLYFLLGLIITAIMQASSATVAIILTALNAKLIGFSAAAAMVIGADIGTTFTILLGAIGGGAIKTRVAYSQVGFNLITGILALLALPLLVWIVEAFVNLKTNPVQGLVFFHTIFNLLGVLIFIPLLKPLTHLLERMVKIKKVSEAHYINKDAATMIDTALLALRNEIFHLSKKVLRFNLRTLDVKEKLVFSDYNYLKNNRGKASVDILKQYESIKHLQAEIIIFAAGIQMRELEKTELDELQHLMHGARMSMHSAKTLKDIKHNFENFENEENAYLNDQYTLFRKRIVEIYLRIDKLSEPDFKENKTQEILLLLDAIREEDKKFINATFKAINAGKIEDINISNIIIANRAFVQSSRQILLGLRELLLNKEELLAFKKLHDKKDAYLEIEDE